jgi:membrane fusion protein, multidrug efflux system
MPVDAKLAFRPTAPAAKCGAPQEQLEQSHLPFDVPVTRREAPREQPERPSEKTFAPQKAQSPPRPWMRWALFGMLPLALIAGAYWYVTGGQVMSTDDAYVEVETVGVSTDVPGIVKDVDVTNNQYVEPGQVLYRLDPRQFQIALDNAKASLAQTALTIDAMKQDYQRMLSDAAAQQGEVALDQATYDRNAMLLPNGTTSKATYDQARYTLETDKNKLESLRQQAAEQLARLAGNPNIPVTQHPLYLQARAQVQRSA